jgi:hypothetical protein
MGRISAMAMVQMKRALVPKKSSMPQELITEQVVLGLVVVQ